MAIRISKAAQGDNWLAQAIFGLILGGLAAWLVVLYSAPLNL
jgi:hypothetical protein